MITHKETHYKTSSITLIHMPLKDQNFEVLCFFGNLYNQQHLT